MCHKSLDQLAALKKWAKDPNFQCNITRVKQEIKLKLAQILEKDYGVKINPAYMFDIQDKRIREYKSQLLNCLHILTLYKPHQKGSHRSIYTTHHHDFSEQISTAGTEASGTGSMKFMLNGALTVGTLDGAKVNGNIFIFGMTVDEMEAISPHNEFKNIADILLKYYYYYLLQTTVPTSRSRIMCPRLKIVFYKFMEISRILSSSLSL